MYYFQKRNKNTKPTLCSLNFTLQTLRACVQTDAQILIFLFYASACTMHGSIIRPNPIPEKTIIVLMILTLCLAPYISYPNFTLFMLMILRLINTCKGPIKISKGPLILGYMHVFEWGIRRCTIYADTSESMCTKYWLTACSSLPRKKCG